MFTFQARSLSPTTQSLISLEVVSVRAGLVVVMGRQFWLKEVENLGIMALWIQNRTNEQQKWRLRITGVVLNGR